MKSISSRSWFLRQFRLNSFKTYSERRPLATEKFETLEFSMFSVEMQKFHLKNKIQLTIAGDFTYSTFVN